MTSFDSYQTIDREPPLKIEVFSSTKSSETHPEDNEDYAIKMKNNGLIAVLDGVGGKRGGREASHVTGQLLEKYFKDLPFNGNFEQTYGSLVNGVNKAHILLSQARNKREYEEFKDMDTTLALVKTFSHKGKDYALILSVGDSRVYSFRNGRKPPLLCHTLDDGILKEKYKGEEESTRTAKISRAQEIFDNMTVLPDDEDTQELYRKRNLINNSMGSDNFMINKKVVDIKKGDLLIAMTDGISDTLTFNEMTSILNKYSSNPEVTLSVLIDRATKTEGIRAKKDDRTGVIMKIG